MTWRNGLRWLKINSYTQTHLAKGLERLNALVTPRPDVARWGQTKPCQMKPDGSRPNFAGSIWLPWPEVCQTFEGSWPDCARQHQILSSFVIKWNSGAVWHNLFNLFQVSDKLLVQEARLNLQFFCLAPSGYDLVWSSWCWCNQSIIELIEGPSLRKISGH